MRLFIVATCVVLVAAAGYFVWRDLSDRAAAAQHAQAVAEYRKGRELCLGYLRDLNDNSRKLAEYCVLDGFIDAEDIRRRGR